MTTGYILIAAILILGGVIATAGDRIGTKVGKARLSLFKLRPKNTAVVITILTGVLTAATTLAILFLADEGLRKGVFELEDIQKDLRQKREQLKVAEEQKSQVESELKKANQQLQTTITEKRQVETQREEAKKEKIKVQQDLAQTQAKLQRTQNQYQQAITELGKVYNQIKSLQTAIAQLRAERERLYAEAKKAIEQRDRELANRQAAIEQRDRELSNRQAAIEQRDRKISELDKLIQNRNLEIRAREQVIAKREVRLKELEKQQDYLEQEVARLEKYYQSYRDLRLGKLALVRGQVIASALVRVNQTTAARQAIVQLLQEANRNASIELAEPGTNSANTELLRLTPDRIEQLVQQINDGREYVVRIFSAGNYVRGEKQIEFFADAARNVLVFSAGEVLATTNADPKSMTSYQLRQRLDLLISASQFRARNAGIVEGVQIDGTFIRFLSVLRQFEQPLEIKAVAAEDTYTVGPLRVKLLVIQNGKVVLST
ncbi:hypothetical protein Nos7524_5134 [Nostoc sp. PCC 7524]|uniref:DUF3084 domain-containing protein n=1 Tax=Nostoc sp. (strain ATCC 29411 / PCC 7524) TaxID=28072 RepID=UPI00029ED3C0|nr:DUF3084 domain-containing protein [Nostoc sp. PCC 7524]AFY50858.1 hypothetical protein Nos7524_5134 [Nostoc sp. PCC 7524]